MIWFDMPVVQRIRIRFTNLTAKQKRVDSFGFPSILNCMKAAAWPSIGWDTFRSTE